MATVLCYEGRLSLYCFLGGMASLLVFYGAEAILHDKSIWTKVALSVGYYISENVIIRIRYNPRDYQIAVRAAFLGAVLSAGIVVFLYAQEQYKSFGIYATLMALFHYTEYLGIAICNPKTLSPDSFILNHSIHYGLAAAASWIEYFVESYYFPEMKTYKLVWTAGVLICLAGESLRKVAMITASKNFSHIVQFERHNEHELVTHGVYGWTRHPSYVGWFYWSIGTQITLANPVCFVIYAIASWKFFHDRILMEEITLLNFFGEEYIQYQERVPSGLPFIRGFRVEP
ncbi:protein-S-isoprenylcysteine O-methyltransferase [Anopheles maculipalpis]|uniref:protein-S-isoprenylcysteine O-methyltransferase n=1 Tax=Anopheles maculipalpis TaxID=1496333 RepID=UPI00215909A2|nr:protein-S-isoprenylcysteine O-methyltransferase [Anopheles maculipalpis]